MAFILIFVTLATETRGGNISAACPPQWLLYGASLLHTIFVVLSVGEYARFNAQQCLIPLGGGRGDNGGGRSV